MVFLVSHQNFSFLFIFLMCKRLRVACSNPCILHVHLLTVVSCDCIEVNLNV